MDVQRDLQAVTRLPVRRQPAQGGGQAFFGCGARAQFRDERLDLEQGVRGQLLDAEQLARRTGRVPVQQQAGRLCGQVHAEDRLRDRIVQVARQPVALLFYCQACRLVGIALQLPVDSLQLVEGAPVPIVRGLGHLHLIGISAEQDAVGAVQHTHCQPEKLALIREQEYANHCQ